MKVLAYWAFSLWLGSAVTRLLGMLWVAVNFPFSHWNSKRTGRVAILYVGLRESVCWDVGIDWPWKVDGFVSLEELNQPSPLLSRVQRISQPYRVEARPMSLNLSSPQIDRSLVTAVQFLVPEMQTNMAHL
jgi:hypothetical protein